MAEEKSSDWLDKTGFGVVGRFTLDDGEQVTAEIVEFNEGTNEIVVQPIPGSASQINVEQLTRAIAVDCVLSFDPEANSSHISQHSDPCRNSSFSISRFVLMTTLFLSATVGSLALFITFMNREPYRLQELSTISYTFAVVFATFAAIKGDRHYLFSCPIVKSQISQLLLRHVGFLIALVLLESAGLAIRSSLPAWWSLRDSKGGTPFELFLSLSCYGLGFVEVFTNRSILQRAHSEFAA